MSDDFKIKDKIRECYLKILEREPDEIGFIHYYNEIKLGLLKIENLSHILESSEEFRVLHELKNGHTKTKEGFDLFVDPDDKHISRIISLTGKYEADVTDFFKKTIKTGMTVTDIGANIGFFTTFFSRLVGLQGKVISFEPSPRSFHVLEKNLENCLNNVTIINKAVSDFTGRDKFHLSKENTGDNRLAASIILDTDYQRKMIEVDVITLDDYFQDKHLDLLKMDAQGAEMKILVGGKRTIEKNPDLKIITEFWPIGLAAHGTNGEEFLCKLQDLGFKIYELEGSEPKKITIKELCARYTGTLHGNLYCSRS